jgi:hypothetical protein
VGFLAGQMAASLAQDQRSTPQLRAWKTSCTKPQRGRGQGNAGAQPAPRFDPGRYQRRLPFLMHDARKRERRRLCGSQSDRLGLVVHRAPSHVAGSDLALVAGELLQLGLDDRGAGNGIGPFKGQVTAVGGTASYDFSASAPPSRRASRCCARWASKTAPREPLACSQSRSRSAGRRPRPRSPSRRNTETVAPRAPAPSAASSWSWPSDRLTLYRNWVDEPEPASSRGPASPSNPSAWWIALILFGSGLVAYVAARTIAWILDGFFGPTNSPS